jgi:hypothetical protein
MIPWHFREDFKKKKNNPKHEDNHEKEKDGAGL